DFFTTSLAPVRRRRRGDIRRPYDASGAAACANSGWDRRYCVIHGKPPLPGKPKMTLSPTNASPCSSRAVVGSDMMDSAAIGVWIGGKSDVVERTTAT